MIMRVRHPHPGYATPPLEGIRNRTAGDKSIGHDYTNPPLEGIKNLNTVTNKNPLLAQAPPEAMPRRGGAGVG